jgi:hypothetical protein
MCHEKLSERSLWREITHREVSIRRRRRRRRRRWQWQRRGRGVWRRRRRWWWRQPECIPLAHSEGAEDAVAGTEVTRLHLPAAQGLELAHAAPQPTDRFRNVPIMLHHWVEGVADQELALALWRPGKLAVLLVARGDGGVAELRGAAELRLVALKVALVARLRQHTPARGCARNVHIQTQSYIFKCNSLLLMDALYVQ